MSQHLLSAAWFRSLEHFADTWISLISVFHPKLRKGKDFWKRKNSTRDVVATVLNISSNTSDAEMRDLTQQLLKTRQWYLPLSPSPAQYAKSTWRQKPHSLGTVKCWGWRGLGGISLGRFCCLFFFFLITCNWLKPEKPSQERALANNPGQQR